MLYCCELWCAVKTGGITPSVTKSLSPRTWVLSYNRLSCWRLSRVY